ncbi:hypothetical protein [Phocaeicola plebeius]|uniref:hypothetical protein n=1 Tax=Phocaeicola plebeius TaxID=310297 RepID=UPI003FEFF23B
MNVKLKDGRILPIEENSLIALNDNGETLEVNVDEIESFDCDGINWKKVRIDIAMKMLDIAKTNELYQVDYSEMIFNKANELTKKLMEDIK